MAKGGRESLSPTANVLLVSRDGPKTWSPWKYLSFFFLAMSVDLGTAHLFHKTLAILFYMIIL